MKNLIIIAFCLLCILTSCGKGKTKKSIAILTPVSHPSLELIEKGFVETIENQAPGKYRFTTYNGQGNKSLLRSEVEEISRKEFDLVLTIGTSPTQMITQVFSKKKLATPVVFTAVNVTEELSGDFVTGVKEMLKFNEEIEALISYKPNLSNILLVYNPAEPGLQKDRNEVSQILQKKRIALTVIEVFQTNELKAKVSPFLTNKDAVIVLKDNTVVAGIEVLSKLCNENKIPLMASDLDSPDRGAAFGFGVHESNFGIEAAKKALQILESGVLPDSIPITPVADFTLRINKQAAKAQGIEVLL